MPDLLLVFTKRWKLIVLITLLATAVAWLFTFLSPQKYMAVATALPANSLVADKARIFNQNIQQLYSDFGAAYELDKLEGTGKLDTLFIAASEKFGLDQHYKISPSDESIHSAAAKLKKNSKINRSGYGELQVKVWDKDRHLSAQLANFLMQKIQELHQNLQNESNTVILERLKTWYAEKERQYTQRDSTGTVRVNQTRAQNLANQLQEYAKLIDEYHLAVNTNAPVLLVVENARPPLWPDKPKIMATVLLSFFSAFVFSFLLAVFLEAKKYRLD